LRRVLAAAAVAALVVCSPAWAHRGGASNGYRSVIRGVKPALPGVTLRVLGGDEELEVRTTGKASVIVLGYSNEPYLRVGPDGAFQNLNSPATYLNRERYGGVEVPARAKPTSVPSWKQINDKPAAEWHDHRIHWMSKTAPPVVAADPGQPHRVFNWQVPLRSGGRGYRVAGSLEYTPVDTSSGSSLWWIVLALGAIGVLTVTFVLLRWRLRVRGGPPEPQP
jgi:hypothetical protein